MRNKRRWEYGHALLLAAFFVVASAVPVFAVTSSSNNYQIVETEFGSGSALDSCSGVYCARATIGSLAIGNAQAGESAAEFGSITPDEPTLEVIVDPGVSKLGDLTTERTAAKTMIVRVRSYLSDGYTLQINGTPPRYKNHVLATPSSPVASKPGTEQFAINVVANTFPGIGANPVQVPSGQMSFGQVEADYSTPNLFKYVNGEVVARSNVASGRTDYTISMIVNISNSTPAGHFAGDFSAVVVPFY